MNKVYVNRDLLLEKAKGTDAYFQIKSLLTDICIADVAPRAEVEEFQAECNKWQERLKTECEYTEAITKKKVAREIFEEIESKLTLNKATHCGQKFYYIRLEDDIAELKNKYAEVQK